MSVITIAVIQIDTEAGDLLLKNIHQDNYETVTIVIDAADKSPRYKTKAKGVVSFRKIARMLNEIND